MKSRTLKIVSVSISLVVVVLVSFIYISGVAMSRAESVQCANNMISIGFGARLWANDRVELMPTNFICMSNELVTPKVLHCRTDRAHASVNSWEEFSDEKSSYLMVSPGSKEGTTNVVFIRCRIHRHLGFPDGSVTDAGRTKVFRKS